MTDIIATGRACKCTHALSLFCASLIPQDWMQSDSHCPAVRCPCGKTYVTLRGDTVHPAKEQRK